MKAKFVIPALIVIASFALFKFSQAPVLSVFPKNHKEDVVFGKSKFEKGLIRPMKIEVSDEVLSDLKERLDRTRFYDSHLEGIEWKYGSNLDYMKDMIQYWRTQFDWKKQEKFLNDHFPSFLTQIDGLDIHFVHIKADRSKYPNPYCLMLVHGWPGSFYEFYKVAPFLTDPLSFYQQNSASNNNNNNNNENLLAFDLIIPSIPGYAFSEGPSVSGLSVAETAAIFMKLIKVLGYNQYFVQGGDWGSVVATSMAQLDDKNCLGVHLNLFPSLGSPLLAPFRYFVGYFFPSLILPSLTEQEKVFPASQKLGLILENCGYFILQGTYPDTLGYSLTDSPVGLAAWIAEKFFVWSDNDGKTLPFTQDELLTNIMLYWLNNVGVKSVRYYKEFVNSQTARGVLFSRVTVPAGLIDFPKEFTRTPESWAKFKYVNMKTYTNSNVGGGHFAALERPHLLVQDIFNFCSKVLNLKK